MYQPAAIPACWATIAEAVSFSVKWVQGGCSPPQKCVGELLGRACEGVSLETGAQARHPCLLPSGGG